MITENTNNTPIKIPAPVLNPIVLRMLIRGERMGYCIHYQSEKKKDRTLRNYSRLTVLIAACFLVFLLFVETCWPEGAELIRTMTVFSEEMIPVSALNDLENGLLSGESLVKSWAAFCRDIVS